MSDDTDPYPETLEEAKEMFPDSPEWALKAALRDLRQAERDARDSDSGDE